ncbi:hypothetical protein MNBD_GAMMA12-3067 [hydrothermal vent metagenome]|uniref:Type VI secretion system FHA domain-containing protein n=1 Tax=hydrothermal vent metagenome TaxID=652676 RepID=A0A3B0Y547_9ZZZZ
MDGKLDYHHDSLQDPEKKRGQSDSLRSQKKSTKAGVLALIRGLSNQVVVQLRLAAEFGIPHSQIFTEDYRGLSRREIEKLIIKHLRTGEEGLKKINQLGTDLLAHQIAVISGLDGIVRQTLETLDPKEIKKIKGVSNSKSKAWLAYSKVFTEFNENAIQRHQQIVIPGFVSAYVNARHNQERHPIKIDDLDESEEHS